MKIRELFDRDVTRDIPPVVYFQDQSPEKLRDEVSEYIITGGYPEGHPGRRRVPSGIHEAYVLLLRGIARELQKKGGPELPASWISGFYGSGKSSFAKMLGLALDGATLPDGTKLEKALLARDDSPNREELVAAWQELRGRVDPIAVVFDIGGVARDDEQIHSAVVRQLQKKLGYCSRSHFVAEHELRLELDREWDAFVAAAEKTLGKPWSEAKEDFQADEHFSHVLSVLRPDRYVDPMSWIDSRTGTRTGTGTSAQEAVAAIEAMLRRRAKGKSLFLVVDEVSQYVHQDESRMLKLQSFVSELGQRLKGSVWLLATGQQQLEGQGEASTLTKLKDRFPPHLRVHLGTTNIRDVIHKRLLKKKPCQESALREIFQKHRPDLKLHGYACEALTEDDFVEVYPMLPGHIELILDITSNLRARSTRVQGDDHAIRGLLQLLGELFRGQKLAERDVGHLVTLDAIYDVQHTALDADVQTTLARIAAHPEARDDALAQRAARAVALLELLQEKLPTTPVLVAQCLYDRLGAGNQVTQVSTALENLRAASLLSYSEKTGYKIQSSAGQEWQRERDDIQIGAEKVSELVRAALKELVGATQERARYKGRSFPWALFFSDGKHAHDAKLQDVREDATVTVDFRVLARKEERAATVWVPKSGEDALRNRLVWVAGDASAADDHARALARSERMLERYRSRRETLTREKQRLLYEEEARNEELASTLQRTVADGFASGAVYFRGQELRPRDFGAAFGTALIKLGERALPDLYPHSSELAVTPGELAQLLERDLAGPSPKFMEGALGLLSLDGGRYVASCAGLLPTRVVQEIQTAGGLAGQSILGLFVSPPYGYPADVVKACLAGLLRGKKVRIRPEQGDDIGSHVDPGVREVFTKDRDFRRAEFFPATTGGVTARDRVAMRKFFSEFLGVDVEPEDEAIADHVLPTFSEQRKRLRDVEARWIELPRGDELPPPLVKLGRALEDCCRYRQVDKTLEELKRNLDALRDGLAQLGSLAADLTRDAVASVRKVVEVRNYILAQLVEAHANAGLEEATSAIHARLEAPYPWRDLASLEAALAQIRARYTETRKALLQRQADEVNGARERIKLRTGFATIDADQAHRVLKPLSDVLIDTTADMVSPTLAELTNRFAGALALADEQANARLDDELNRGAKAPIVPVPAELRNKEVATREELRALLDVLEERVGAHLDRGARVRLV